MAYSYKFGTDGEISTEPTADNKLLISIKFPGKDETISRTHPIPYIKRFRKFEVRQWLINTWREIDWPEPIENPLKELEQTREHEFVDGNRSVTFLFGRKENNVKYITPRGSEIFMTFPQIPDTSSTTEIFEYLFDEWSKFAGTIKFPFSISYMDKMEFNTQDIFEYDFQIGELCVEIHHETERGRYLILSKNIFGDAGFLYDSSKFKHIRRSEEMIDAVLNNMQHIAEECNWSEDMTERGITIEKKLEENPEDSDSDYSINCIADDDDDDYYTD